MRRRLVMDRPIRNSDRDKRRRPKSEEPSEDAQSAKQRAQEMVDNGMPYQMAMAVVHGRMELNEALERMSRRDRVNQLMERHELSRALATQVAIGHADLKLILHRRRMKQHRETHRDRTCLVEGAELTLSRFGLEDGRVRVEQVTPYAVHVVKADGGEREEVHKLELKYGYEPGDWKQLRKTLKTHPELASQDRRPAERPQDRYTCSDKRLFGYVDSGSEVSATLIDGDVLGGVLAWFSRYEIGMVLRGGASVVVFRHALQKLSQG